MIGKRWESMVVGTLVGGGMVIFPHAVVICRCGPHRQGVISAGRRGQRRVTVVSGFMDVNMVIVLVGER
jgi:hypothetical protein